METIDDKLLDLISQAPDGQLEHSVAVRCGELKGKSKEEQIEALRNIIGDCINGALASTFMMKVLQEQYKMLTGDYVHGQIRIEKLS